MSLPSTPVLVIEDSPEDYAILTRALRKNDIDLPLKHCQDGYDAIDYLNAKGIYEGDPDCARPAFILLDLNLPGMDGIKIAQYIRSDETFNDIPIIALTTSRNKIDMDASYNAGVNSFIPKPDDIEGYNNIAHVIGTYWFEHSKKQQRPNA